MNDNNDDDNTITITLPPSIESELISTMATVDYQWHTTGAHNTALGWTAQEIEIDTSWINDWEEDTKWRDIRNLAKSNEALQAAIDRVKVLYYLSKEDGQDI